MRQEHGGRLMPRKTLKPTSLSRRSSGTSKSETETDEEVRIRRLEDKVRKQRWRENRPQFDLDSLLDPTERLRSEVFARELCRLAGRHGTRWGGRSKITAFREDYLDGQVLSFREALQLFASRASYLLSPAKFKELGIPIPGHRSSGERAPVRFLQGGIEEVWHLSISSGSTSVTVDHSHVLQPSDPSTQPIRRPADWNISWPHFMEALPGSFIALLVALSQEIAANYLLKPADAALLILADRPPIVSYVRGGVEQPDQNQDHEQVRLVLSLHPWLSARTVGRIYREFQRQVLRRAYRPLNEGRLRLVDFVAPRWHSGDTWRTIFEEWN